MLVLSFPADRGPATALAAAMSINALTVNKSVRTADLLLHRFPDGESRVSVPVPLPEQVVILCSLNQPNEKLIELLLAAAAARANGVKRLILVAPYLCYMRQDAAFHPGEAISQHVIGQLLADAFDGVITVDPHLHRVHQLKQAVPAARALALSATALMGAFIANRVEKPLLLGPDEESQQWVDAIAAGREFDVAVAEKLRSGDSEVSVRLPDHISFTGRHIVLVDDMASTGRTLLAAAAAAKAAGAASVSAIITHALFAGDAWQRLQAADLDAIWSTDSITHPSNVISLAPLLADGVTACL